MADEIQVLDFNDYMKKPVKVQAARLTEDAWAILHEQPNHVMRISGRQVCATEEDNKKYFLIDTLEGLMQGNIGDMLIIGVKGEIYACKPDIFEQTYSRPTANATKTVKIQRTRRAFDEIEFTSNIDIKDLTALLEYMKAADIFVKYDIR